MILDIIIVNINFKFPIPIKPGCSPILASLTLSFASVCSGKSQNQRKYSNESGLFHRQSTVSLNSPFSFCTFRLCAAACRSRADAYSSLHSLAEFFFVSFSSSKKSRPLKSALMEISSPTSPTKNWTKSMLYIIYNICHVTYVI